MAYEINYAQFMKRDSKTGGWEKMEDAVKRFSTGAHAFLELYEKDEIRVKEVVDGQYKDNPEATFNKGAIITMILGQLGVKVETHSALKERVEDYLDNSGRFMVKRGPGGSLARLTDEEMKAKTLDPNYVPTRLQPKTEKKMSRKDEVAAAVAKALKEAGVTTPITK